MSEFDEFDEIETFERFYFRPSGKLNQGSSLFNKSKNLVFEAIQTKFHLFTACDFDFVNHLANITLHHKVGKTAGYSSNSLVYSYDSYFTFDDENIWAYLEDRGVKLEIDSDGIINPTILVFMNNKKIAKIKSCGTHLYDFEECHNKLMEIPTRQYARIDMNPQYIYIVFLVAFTISRTN